MSHFAVCGRCGGKKAGYGKVCPHCGFLPEGDGLLAAWLLSTHHLDEAALVMVRERIRAGESVQPSRRMLGVARAALGQSWAGDPGMDLRQRLALLATSIVLTPLVGWVLAVWWWGTRPRSALQAIALSLPFSVLFFGMVAWMVLVEGPVALP